MFAWRVISRLTNGWIAAASTNAKPFNGKPNAWVRRPYRPTEMASTAVTVTAVGVAEFDTEATLSSCEVSATKPISGDSNAPPGPSSMQSVTTIGVPAAVSGHSRTRRLPAGSVSNIHPADAAVRSSSLRTTMLEGWVSASSCGSPGGYSRFNGL